MGALLALFKPQVQINGRRLVILKRLGEGGFGVVDLVQDRNTGVRYALKRAICEDEVALNAAVQEAHRYSLFNSSNIIKIIDSTTIYGHRTENGSVQDQVASVHARAAALPEQDLWRIFKGVCRAVQQIHHSSIGPLAHRDINASNVMLDNDGTPVLIDFGSMAPARVVCSTRVDALRLQDEAAQNSLLSYRAPELLEVSSGAEVTEATDIWSLGVLLYSMSVGETPFEFACRQGGSLHLAIAQGKHESILSNYRVSDNVRRVIASCLQLDPTARPTIDTLIQIIGDFGEDDVLIAVASPE